MTLRRALWPLLLAALVFAAFARGTADLPEATAATSFACEDAVGLPESECRALMALYASTDGENWTSDTGWLELPNPCRWKFVTCEYGHVKHLLLHDNGLNGTIPPDLGALDSLRQLDLSDNAVSGQVPPELGQLTRLRELNLSRNDLSGTLPPELGQLVELETLALDENRLTGAIPAGLGDLPALRRLYLGENELGGTIPAALGRIPFLLVLSLEGNQLTGGLPPELGGLGGLQRLTVNNNQLDGPLPPELGNLTPLDRLAVDTNHFSGPLPWELTDLPLEFFSYHNTDLCAPDDPAFQAWLASIHSVTGTGVLCSVPPQVADLNLTAAVTQFSAPPGTTVTYRLAVHNLGTVTDSVTLTIDSDWTATGPSSIGPIAAGESAEFDINVSIPPGALAQAQTTTAVTVTSQADATVAASLELTTAAAQVAAVGVEIRAVVDEGVPGATLIYAVDVRNLGNGTDAFALTAAGPWALHLQTTITPALAPNAAATVPMSVTVPLDLLWTDVQVIDVTATSQFDPDVSGQAWATATALVSDMVAVTSGAERLTGPAGTAVTFPLKLTNLAALPTDFTLTADGQWTTALSADNTGPLPTGTTTPISVSVAIPADVHLGDEDLVTVYVSADGQTVAALRLIAVAEQQAAVACAPMEQAEFGPPGTTVTYAVTVTNEGEGVDSFLVALDGPWPATAARAQTAFLPPGTSELVAVTVTVPTDAAPLAGAATQVAFTSHFDPRVDDHALLRTTVPYRIFVPRAAD
jgi:uncharacterized membrane protein